jgi:uncharacterized protein (TIGR00290 family)
MRVVPRAIVSWSSGKDSAFALHLLRQRGELEIVGLLTTINSEFGRVAMHGVREELLDRQASSLGLKCFKVPLPWPCSNAVYEAEVERVLRSAQAEGVTHVVFGDLFLQDIRAYRDQRLAAIGMHGIYPLWQRDTGALAREMVDCGVRATLSCIDPNRLPESFAGRTFDAALLDDLPAGVDPCGENGEFHTFCWAGPAFARPIGVAVGEIVRRDGFVYADLLPR